MALWHWLLRLFRNRAGGPAASDDRRADPQEHRRRVDASAAGAARTADARLPPHQGGINF